MSNMTKTPKTSDVAIRCTTCGLVTRTVLAGSLPNFARGECGHYGRVIKVRITEKECGGACQSAKRGTCDCSCGGENHGIAS